MRHFSLFLVVTLILLFISISDIKEKRIPNPLLGILLLCAIMVGRLFSEPAWAERIAGSVLVSGFLLLVIWLKPGAFGAGDVKLMVVSGMLLGWKNLAAFVFAVVLAGIYCIVCIVGKKKEKKEVIAFGPFLCAGIELAMLFGDIFIRWYIG